MGSGTVLIVSYGRPDLLKCCLESVREFAPGWVVHVWDNWSDDSAKVRELAVDYTDANWHFHDENIGFAAAVNRLASGVSGDFLLLNPDAELTSPVSPLQRLLHAGHHAAAGPMVMTAPLQPWSNARRTPGPLRCVAEYSGYAHRMRGLPWSQRYRRPPRTAGYVSGACLLIAGDAWREVGGFDERFWLYGEEADWARRAKRAGWTVAYHAKIVARHEGAATQKAPSTMHDRDGWLYKAQVTYLEKHSGRLGRWLFESAADVLDRLQHRQLPTAGASG